MEDPLIEDLIVKLFVSKSSLSKNQFFAYLVRKGEISKGELEKIIKKEKIFRTRGALGGSFFQAKNNIRKSIYTLLLLFYLGIWSDKEEKAILSLIKGLKRVRDVSSDRKSDVASYVIEIIENMI